MKNNLKLTELCKKEMARIIGGKDTSDNFCSCTCNCQTKYMTINTIDTTYINNKEEPS